MDQGIKLCDENPKKHANILSKLGFIWMIKVYYKSIKYGLKLTGLYKTLEVDKSKKLGDALEKNWEKELLRAKVKNRDPSLLKAILDTFFWWYMFIGFIVFLQYVVVRSFQPVVLSYLIRCFTNEQTDDQVEMYVSGAIMILLSVIFFLINNHAFQEQLTTGMRIRIAVSSLIYRKILKLNKKSLGETASGQVVNLLSNDVNRFDFSLVDLHHLWIAPFMVAVITYLIWREVQVSSLAGIVAITILTVPFQLYLGKKAADVRQRIATRTDFRVGLMNEVISGIQVIKMYAWEEPFEKLVREARRVEIKGVTIASYIRAVFISSMVFVEKVALFFTILSFVLLDNNITADKVFSLSQFFNILQLSLAIFIPLALSQGGETLVSIRRLQSFLLLEEKEESCIELVGSSKNIHVSQVTASWTNSNCGLESKFNGDTPPNLQSTLILDSKPIEDTKKDVDNKENVNTKEIVDANSSSNNRPTLDKINLKIPAGSLSAIVGPVGSGKSSILQLLLGELAPKSGKITAEGEISYASQEPWLFAATVRNNILFGREYDKDLYQTVVKVCALDTDFKQFPYGDKTKVGERGVSLSGGQRARINLARAVYRNADIYLLDDPLSAVDTHVGKHLFDKCIRNYLAGKTRVLVTHQLQYLKRADVIIVLNNGEIEAQGTFDELSKKDLNFTKMLVSADESTEEAGPRKLMTRLSSVASTKSNASDESHIKEDEEEIGLKKGNGFIEYAKAGGNWLVLISLAICLLAAQVALSGADYWLTYWTQQEALQHQKDSKLGQRRTIQHIFSFDAYLHNSSANIDTFTYNLDSNFTKSENISRDNSDINFIRAVTSDGHLDRNFAIYIYSGLIVAAITITITRSFFFYKLAMTASRKLHFRMFHSLLQAPMRFFDTNPSGRILNRFSKDMGAIDEFLPRAIIDATQIILIMGGIFVMVAITNYWMIIAMVILSIIFVFLRKFYLHTVKEVKQIEGVAKSPVFSHVNSTFYGITTIRACKAEKVLQEEFDNHQDLHTSAWFLMIACTSSFGLWMDFLCTVFVAVITFSFILLNESSEVSGSMVGLAISQSLVLTGFLQYGMKQSADAINQITSVERVLQYTQLDKEGPFETPKAKTPPKEWPRKGNLKFRQLSLKYSQNDPLILKDLSFDVLPGEKIGIVGRTGAGKSSLIAALFRLCTIEGDIVLDGISTQEIGLKDLRSRISIIPQEAVLFSESLRFNLDPFNEYEDGVLWNALEEVELKQKIQSLSFKVNGGGANLSVGERQLVCLARAIVRNSKVLVLDEATANIDPETDSLIQATIRRKFKSCTVLTIAHRLNTIMDSDRVLVLDAGRIIEFDHPHKLLQDKEGHFTKMVQQTGTVMIPQLIAIAQKAFEKKTLQ